MLNRKRERQQDKYLMIEWNENHNSVQKDYKKYQQAIVDEIEHLQQEYELKLLQYNRPNPEQIKIDHTTWTFTGSQV